MTLQQRYLNLAPEEVLILIPLAVVMILSIVVNAMLIVASMLETIRLRQPCRNITPPASVNAGRSNCCRIISPRKQ